MYHIIKKNQKILMAVLGVGLMIVFVLPTSFTQMGGQNPVVAKMGDIDLRYRDFAQGENDWQTLMMVPTVVWNNGQPQIAPLPFLLGADAVQQINQRPELYVILQHEATQMGAFGSEEQLNQLLSSPVISSAQVDINSPAVRGAVQRFIPVLDAYQRLLGTIKITQPMVRQEMAARQAMQIKLVPFDVTPTTRPTTAPSAQAIDEQFQHFASVLPGNPDTRNPFGFGYRYPNQVKLQYVSVPFAQVREVVEQSKSAYQWQVEENRYYIQHPAEFATTQPTTNPSAAPTTQGVAQTTQPSQKSFESVQREIHEKLVHEQTQALAKSVQERISSTINSDFTGFARSPDATTRPATSLGVSYDTFDYLQKLRDEIEAETHVRLIIHQEAEFKSEDALAALTGIGHATYRNVPFAQYAIDSAATFATPGIPDTELLKLQQPSGILTDPLQNTYVFRLTEAQASHAPASAAQVHDQIVADLERKDAFDRVKAAAQQLLDNATKPGADLVQVASADGKTALNIGPVYRGGALPQYPLSGPAMADFDRQIQTLLHLAAQKNDPHPTILIELPTVGKVAVVQLQSVEALWDTQTQFVLQFQIDRALRDQMNHALEHGWFDFDSVVQRTGYKRTDRAAQPTAPQSPPPPLL